MNVILDEKMDVKDRIRKIVVLLSTSLLLICKISAQPIIEWQYTIGGSGSEYSSYVKQTIDGGYIVGGASTSNISGEKTDNSIGGYDYWVIKLSNSGSIEWQRTIGGTMDDKLTTISQTSDGGYILGGESSSGVSGDKSEPLIGGLFDFWIVKLDSAGNIEWENTIGGNNLDFLKDLKETTDGYIIAGYSSSGISGDKSEANQGTGYDYWIVKLDFSGNVVWENTIGGNSNDYATSITLASNNSFIVGGSSISNASSDKTENSHGLTDYWILNLDQNGNIIWQSTIGGNSADELSCLEFTIDNKIIVGGFSYSGVSGNKTEPSQGYTDYWILELTETGSIIWQNTIGGNYDDMLYAMSPCSDGKYMLAGMSASGISGDKSIDSFGGTDNWIIKLDEYGNLIWQSQFGGSFAEEPWKILQTLDGGFVISGFTTSPVSGNMTEAALGGSDFWIYKLGACASPSIPELSSDISFVCASGSELTLTIDSGELFDATMWSWYADSCGGVAIGYGDSIVMTVQEQSTFYVRGEGGCTTDSYCASIVIEQGDVTPPVIPIILDTIVNCSYTPNQPHALDNCNGIIPGVTNTVFPLNTLGSTTVTWIFDDGNGNISIGEQTITIQDTTSPIPPSLDTLYAECGFIPTIPDAIDNCLGTISGTTNTTFPLNNSGNNIITWTFNDGNGNISSAEQVVTILDTTAPVIPLLDTLVGECGFIPPIPYGLDNCTDTVFGITQTTIPMITSGTNTVVWIFEDINGNLSQTEQIIEIGPCLNVTEHAVELFIVYPNPTNSAITFKLSADEALCELYDSNGKLLIIKSIKNGDTLFLNSFENGVYFVMCFSEGKAFIEKIVKL